MIVIIMIMIIVMLVLFFGFDIFNFAIFWIYLFIPDKNVNQYMHLFLY